MKITINLERKYIAYLIITAAIVSSIGYAIAQSQNPGHLWSQIDCSSCVTSGNVNFNYAGSSSKGGAATSALVANSVNWANVVGRPTGTVTLYSCPYVTYTSGCYGWQNTYIGQLTSASTCNSCVGGAWTAQPCSLVGTAVLQ